MQTANSYPDFEKEIEEIENVIAETLKKLVALKLERKATKEAIKDIENSWEAEKSKINKIAQDESFLAQEKRQKDLELMQKKADLAKRIHEDKLKSLISEQPTFEDALRTQVQKFSEDRMSGLSFEQASDATKVADGILERMNRHDFSISTVDWRAAKGHYESVLRDLCEAKLNGKKLTSQDAHYRFLEIEKCLRKQETFLFP